MRAMRVASLLVAERTPRCRIDPGMARRIQLAVRASDGVRIVLLLRARVVRPWCPEAERAGRTGCDRGHRRGDFVARAGDSTNEDSRGRDSRSNGAPHRRTPTPRPKR